MRIVRALSLRHVNHNLPRSVSPSFSPPEGHFLFERKGKNEEERWGGEDKENNVILGQGHKLIRSFEKVADGSECLDENCLKLQAKIMLFRKLVLL